MISYVRRLVLLALGVSLVAGPLGAQPKNVLFEKYKRSVVRLTVTGSNLGNKHKQPTMGSGFIISSGPQGVLILTAAHVVGSDQKIQALNADWLIKPDGTLDRSIKIEIPDEHGALIELSRNAAVTWQDDQKDISVLFIDRTGLIAIPLMQHIDGLHSPSQEVTVLGFRKDEMSLDMQASSGRILGMPQRGQVYRMDLRIPEGESGGPVIEHESGKVIAVISENEGSGAEHHAALIFPALPFLLHFVKKVEGASAEKQTAENDKAVVPGNNNIIIQGGSKFHGDIHNEVIHGDKVEGDKNVYISPSPSRIITDGNSTLLINSPTLKDIEAGTLHAMGMGASAGCEINGNVRISVFNDKPALLEETPWRKVRVLDGTCKDKVGWVAEERIRFGD